MWDVMLTLTIIDVIEIGGREFILTRGCILVDIFLSNYISLHVQSSGQR